MQIKMVCMNEVRNRDTDETDDPKNVSVKIFYYRFIGVSPQNDVIVS